MRMEFGKYKESLVFKNVTNYLLKVGMNPTFKQV